MTYPLEVILGSPATPLGRLRRALREPTRTQRRLLRTLLKRAAETAWGREHGFAKVLRFDDLVPAFQECAPLCGYEDVRPYVTRARAGERDVLWPGRVRHFGISGGTVTSGELIPVTDVMLRTMARCSLVPGLQYTCASGRPGFLRGKILSVPGGVSEDSEHPGVFVGEVSGLMARAVPPLLARWFQAIPRDVMLMEGWDDKVDRIAHRAATQDVRAVVMVPSWAPLLFDAVLEMAADRRRPPPRSVRDVWPRLQVFFAGGVALRSYRPVLEQYLGTDIDFIETYTASEGFYAFQDRLSASDMLLHVNSGVFYEFVEVRPSSFDASRRHTIADVEPGVDYALYVSTCSGLWSYGVQDVVRFTSTDPLRLQVVGRTIAILDEFGEALRADEVSEALQVAASKTGLRCQYHHVTYSPLSGVIPRHEWLLEFAREAGDVDGYMEAVDTLLQERNRHYRIRREPNVLAPPEVTVLPPGTCLRYLRTRARLSAQTKLLPVSAARDVADALREAAAIVGRPSGR